MVRPACWARLERKAQDRAFHIAELIVQEITTGPETPHLTGRLRQSYYATRTPDGAAVNTTARYWKYVEYGTGNHEAQPHVRPAVEYVRSVFD